ncbi:phage antirepressor KilAC domain-containing protein [Dubosiella newyorkensis]|uniref:phage antirepressor KilAC domain-containing protein n=1 Tax=Dubosiella newyorkensis TaxID=1862672 RepID=UPI0025737583|nr:phage antirepressor KilAC domain-containing protein [Dubosiella newyorkensis]
MNELRIFNEEIIPVYKTDTSERVVIGRELHEKLGIRTEYKDWFPRMIEYGFEDGKDFSSFLSESTGGRPRKEHLLKFDMAKHIAMIQRTPIGMAIRNKLIELEKAVSQKDSYMIEDPIERAKAWIKERENLDSLKLENKIQAQQIKELQPKASYYDVVLNCKDLLSISKIAKDYGWSAIKMNSYLHERGVQFKQGDIWLLYQRYADKGYTNTKTHPYIGSDGETHTRVHTHWTQKGRLFIYDLLKADGVLPIIEREQNE